MRVGLSETGWDRAADADAPLPGYASLGAVALGSLLPAIYQEFDERALDFTAALDAVLAPVWLTIDCFDAYLDPDLGPVDMIAWLSRWVGLVADDNWPPSLLRALVARAFELYRWTGTGRGLADLVEAFTGARPEVQDNGAVTVSSTAGSAPRGSGSPAVVVRLPDAGLDEAGVQRVTRLVRAATPAHVSVRVEIA